jgi:hypothetical protein
MTLLTLIALALSAVVHALPAVALIGRSHLERAYGVSLEDPGVVLLLRHRAVLFGILAAAAVAALFSEALRTPVLVASLVSVGSYVILWRGQHVRSAKLDRVARVDVVMVVVLGAGLAGQLV